MDLFTVFIFCLLFVLCALAAVYKLIGYLINKRKHPVFGNGILNIVTAVILIIIGICGIKTGRFLYKNPSITDPDYDRGTYSVLLYNNTDKEIYNIDILAGENKVLFCTVDVLEPKEYKKINISTHESEFIDSLTPSYNVYVRNGNEDLCVGYFGIDTGGFELIDIDEDISGTIAFTQESHSTYRYLKYLRKHNRDQDQVSWYDR
jgi:hypothetical protein